MKKKIIKTILSLLVIIFIAFMLAYNKTTEKYTTYALLLIAAWQIGTWLGDWVNGEKNEL